tara:strand:- start:27 stop:419 length:393 start_codon:yes stop_codon:yes gene_type:complete
MKSKVILLIRTIKNLNEMTYQYPLEERLKGLKIGTFFSCDSQSDQVMLHYGKELIENHEKIFFIVDARVTSELGTGQSLLNAGIRKQNVRLLCLGESRKLVPFLKVFKGKVFASEDELVDYLKSNESASF